MMSINETLSDSIVNQFTANNRLNLFYKNLDFQNHFLEETKNMIRKCRLELLQIEGENRSAMWVDLMTEKALDTFCDNNQFIDIRDKNVTELRKLYRKLWEEILDELKTEQIDFDFIQKSHLKRLTTWLMQTNGFVRDFNDPESLHTMDVACSEYSAEFQLKIFNIDISEIQEPVLDIGCGKNAGLIKYLHEKGKEAFGLDRLAVCNDYQFRVDWLDFEFQPYTWGTIFSNLSFALHFTNHHYRKNGHYILYARKYMEILNSLKNQGVFYYAPGLPFIEAHLPKDKFKTETHRINEFFSYSKITRI